MSDEIIGGLLTGLGSGIIDNHRRKREDAIARRQEFLEDARAARMRRETVEDRNFQTAAQSAQLEAQLAATREENEKNRMTDIEIAEAELAATREEGDKNRKMQIEIAQLRSGGAGLGDGGDRPTPQEIQRRKEEAKQLIGVGMGMNSPMGDDEEKRKNFVKAVNAAFKLIDSGYPVHEVTQVAIGAATERPLPTEEARKMARKQLGSSLFKDLYGGSPYQEKINELAKKLVSESLLYDIQFRQMRASANDRANMPSGIGTKESPFIIKTNQEREWANKYKLPGQYIKFRDRDRALRVTLTGSAY